MNARASITIDRRTQIGKIWALVKPFWQSDERGIAWLLLGVVIALNLGIVYLMVVLNQWNNDFYNSLQEKNYDQFMSLLAKFCFIAAIYIAVAVYQTYLRQLLQIRWRRWLTRVFLADWLAHRCYYRIELTGQGTDNPDQRIQEDLKVFTDATLSLGIDFMRSLVTLASFVTILWGLSGDLAFTVGGHAITIPGYMMWAAVVYAIAGTWITHRLGRPLIRLNFQQQRLEADLRFGLVRLRENAEGVAFYRGEADEEATLTARFERVLGNFMQVMKYNKRLGWFTVGYDQVAMVFPILVASKRYFSDQIQLGGLMQIASAFGRVQESLSWFISSYTGLAEWKATVDRLTDFHEAIQAATAASATDGIVIAPGADAAMHTRGLDVALPDGTTLLADVDCELAPGSNVLVTGPSGVGKSTLFRALAGIWPFGRGRVEVPHEGSAMFLPQRAYLPLGTLRSTVTYPAGPGAFSDAEVGAALEACGLAQLVPLLDEEHRWSQRLSPGEQQRLAFARVLLNKPDWLFLDEATSALDEATEQRVYGLVAERLPATTVISIAHRPGVAAFHTRRLHVEAKGTGPARVVAAMA